MSACMSVQPRSTPAERCTEYGYERGTDSYRDCLAEEVRNDQVIASSNGSDARRARSQSGHGEQCLLPVESLLLSVS